MGTSTPTAVSAQVFCLFVFYIKELTHRHCLLFKSTFLGMLCVFRNATQVRADEASTGQLHAVARGWPLTHVDSFPLPQACMCFLLLEGRSPCLLPQISGLGPADQGTRASATQSTSVTSPLVTKPKCASPHGMETKGKAGSARPTMQSGSGPCREVHVSPDHGGRDGITHTAACV